MSITDEERVARFVLRAVRWFIRAIGGSEDDALRWLTVWQRIKQAGLIGRTR